MNLPKLSDSLSSIKQRYRLRFLAPLLLMILLVIGALYWLNRGPLAKREYSSTYRLVSQKISRSAAININLPAKMTFNPGTIVNDISIEPKIEGSFVSKTDKILIFQPKEKLAKDEFYRVTLATINGKISGDFQAVDDPKIINILPTADSESGLNNDISIIFNRPMVPLSVLSSNNDLDLPIEISPATPGRWKWQGSQTLQFIPANGLIPSAHYKVKIKQGLNSLDGLAVAPLEHDFQTLNLRYLHNEFESVLFNEPIRFFFNGQIDLERKSREIKLTASSSIDSELVTSFSRKKVWNEKTGQTEEVDDQTVLEIRKTKDKHGRSGLWDFNSAYVLTVDKAFPLGGDIALEEKLSRTFTVPDIVKSVEAVSSRSNQVSKDLFDPQGYLAVSFYEDISLKDSRFESDKLSRVEYGQKCLDNQLDIGNQPDCLKTEDLRSIRFYFDSARVVKGEKIILRFARLLSSAGLKLEENPTSLEIKALDDLRILQTVPASKSKQASVNQLILCTNNPLSRPDAKEYRTFFEANRAAGIRSWDDSFLVQTYDYADRRIVCPPKQFQTSVGWELEPNQDYEIGFTLVDHFSSQIRVKLDFATGKMPNNSLLFWHLQGKNNMTTPDNTEMAFATENFDYVDVNLCRLDPAAYLKSQRDYINYWRKTSDAVNCQESIDKRISLPKKYWVKNYFRFNIKDYVPDAGGQWLITFSNPAYRDRSSANQPVYERVFLSVSSIGIAGKKVGLYRLADDPFALRDKDLSKMKNIYWLVDLKTLEPLSDAVLEPYIVGESIKKSGQEFRADSHGVVEMPVIDKLGGVAVSHKGDTAVMLDDYNTTGWGSTAFTAKKTYLYTDRPIYRPGDTVHFKGLMRIGFDTDFEIFKDKPVVVKAYDSRGVEISSKALQVNDFGTFNGSIVLNSKAPLGSYSLQGDFGYAFFDVQEYKPAAFKVDLKTEDNNDEYISGDTATVALDANYYFGVPLESGTVEFTLTAQDYYFDKYQDEWFSFGSSWYTCYSCGYGDRFLYRVKAEVKNGKAALVLPLDLKKLIAGEGPVSSKLINIFARVTNSTGDSVSGQKTIVVHAGEYYIGLNPERYFTAPKEKFKIKIKTVNTQGKPVGAKDISIYLNRVEWVYNKRQQVDGGFYYQWQKKLHEEKKTQASTDSDGNGLFEMSAEKEGEYEVAASTTDSRGNSLQAIYNIYVSGSNLASVEPTNDDTLSLVAGKKSYKAGETASFIIKSPYAKAKALVSIERGKVYEYKIIDIVGSFYEYRFEIKPEYVPNIYASVLLLSGKPEEKFGYLNFTVDREYKNLRINIKTDKERYLPGEEVKLALDVLGFGETKELSELSLAVADMSVLALKGNPKKNPLNYFYDDQPLGVFTLTNLKILLKVADVVIGGKGGGGSNPDDLSKKKRGDFRDTAYWLPVLESSKTGQATTSFRLPDNLTSWQIESIGITKDTKIGTAYKEIMAKKPLMLNILKPRFILPGDSFSVGAKVFNETDQTLNAAVTIENTTLDVLESSNSKNIKLPPGETRTVYFRVMSSMERQFGEHALSIKVKSGNWEDEVEQNLPINPLTTYETVSTAGETKDEARTEFLYLPGNIDKRLGSVRFDANATLAVFFDESLGEISKSRDIFPTVLAAKLRALLAARKVYGEKEYIGHIKEVYIGQTAYPANEALGHLIDELNSLSVPGGGYGYHAGANTSSLYVTEAVSAVLYEAKLSGLQINETNYRQGLMYMISVYGNEKYPLDQVLRILDRQPDLPLSENVRSRYINEIKKAEKNANLWNNSLDNSSVLSAIKITRAKDVYGSAYQKMLYGLLDNRLKVNARGAYLKPGRIDYYSYESNILDTIRFLKEMAVDGHDNHLKGQMMRWIMETRTEAGIWGSAEITAQLLSDLGIILETSGGLKSDFSLALELNKIEQGKYDFNEKNIFSTWSLNWPVSQLMSDDLNLLTIKKKSNSAIDNAYYYSVSMTYHLPIENLPPKDEGFAVDREMLAYSDGHVGRMVEDAKVGDMLISRLKIIVSENSANTVIEDYIPAGMELVNFNLQTEDGSILAGKCDEYDYSPECIQERYINEQKNKQTLYPDMSEFRDDSIRLFKENLPAGTYIYEYYVRALNPGRYAHLPAVVKSQKFPEIFGRTAAGYFEIKQ